MSSPSSLVEPSSNDDPVGATVSVSSQKTSIWVRIIIGKQSWGSGVGFFSVLAIVQDVDRETFKNGNVSVLEAGFLWRVRVLQGPASRNNYIGLFVVQVRMAGPGCLIDGCPNVPPKNLDC
jgi:hypothetical protein